MFLPSETAPEQPRCWSNGIANNGTKKNLELLLPPYKSHYEGFDQVGGGGESKVFETLESSAANLFDIKRISYK